MQYSLERYSKKIFKLSLSLSYLAFHLTGCTVGPTYHLTPLKTPEKWSNVPALETTEFSLPKAWWNVLNDSSLNTLMDLALHDNPSIAQAIARIDQARASIRKEEAANLPAFTASTNASRSRTNENIGALPSDSSGIYQNGLNSGINSLGVLPYNTTPIFQSNLTTGITASWELDLFGRIRRSIEAAQARLDARTVEADSVKLSLQSQIVENWFLLRACELRQIQLGLTTRSREESYKLTGLRVKTGFSSQADYAFAHVNWMDAQNQQESQDASCKQLRQILIALACIDSTKLDELAPPNHPSISDLPIPPQFTLGLPAEVLIYRFDIVSAERNLAAASADIGIVEAGRYPSLSLSASLGKQWISSDGTTIDINTGAIGPTLSLPLFDGGQRRAQSDIAYARYTELKNTLRQQVYQAAKEVEDALIRLQSSQIKAKNLNAMTQSYLTYFQAAEARYKAGMISLIDLENQRRNWLTAQSTQINLSLERLQAWISLVRATGGNTNTKNHP